VGCHLDVQITGACFSISRQAVEYLLPISDEMQVGSRSVEKLG
jgi:hypothetical protein